MSGLRRLVALGAVMLLPMSGQAALADPGSIEPLPANGSCLPPPRASEPAVPWGQQQLAPQSVWPITRGSGVLVGVVDTGVDAHNPQLAGRVRPGRDVINPGGGTADSDCYGHGTFVSGIIAAAPASDTGFAGVAPEAEILPIRAANTANDGTAALLGSGIRAAVDAGARVINVSASTVTPAPELAAAVAYAAAHDVLIVASAANSAQKGNRQTYPASYPSVIAVGAIDSTGRRADFSETGPYLDLVAPGVNVVSIGPGGPGQWLADGTSYAAPFVAGVAALVRAYRPHLTADQVRHRLTVTADHPAAALPDPELGWGTVDPMAAVTTILPEEGAAGAAEVAAPAAPRPASTASDSLGQVLVVIAVFAVVTLGLLVRMAARLGPAGNRRRWRPARTLHRRGRETNR